MSATTPPQSRLACPACGVAVLPGYVRCPKCHAGLPFGTGRQRRTTVDPGGTSMASVQPPGGFPMLAVVGAVIVAGGIAIAFGLTRGSSAPAPAPAPPESATLTTHAPVKPPPGSTGQIVVPPPTTTTVTPVAPNPEALAGDLHLALQHLRLYASVHANVAAARLEVRSAQCNEPDMAATIGRARDNLRAAGLTKWKCIEESGVPVFEKEL